VLILLLTYFQLALLPPSLSSSPLTILKTIWIMNLGDSGHVDRERETRYIKNVLSLSLHQCVCGFSNISRLVYEPHLPTRIYIYSSQTMIDI
jgi:hypothetical protein